MSTHEDSWLEGPFPARTVSQELASSLNPWNSDRRGDLQAAPVSQEQCGDP
jgi:hypothetical protein